MKNTVPFRYWLLLTLFCFACATQNEYMPPANVPEASPSPAFKELGTLNSPSAQDKAAPAIPQSTPKAEAQTAPRPEVQITPVASGTPSPTPSPKEVLQTEPVLEFKWPKEGYTAPGYGVFRDDLMFAILQATQKVAIITDEFNDGDIATALFRAKLKGIKLLVVLIPTKKISIQSRGNYLSRAGITTIVFPSVSVQKNLKIWGGKTTFAIDDAAFRASSSLDERETKPVRIDPSPFTASEIFEFETADGAKRFSAEPGLFQERAKSKPSLKEQTKEPVSEDPFEGVTSGKLENARTAKQVPVTVSKKDRAKRLPRETIIQMRKKARPGVTAPDRIESRENDLSSVPVKQPPAPNNETELTE
jgi:hypothetical protein